MFNTYGMDQSKNQSHFMQCIAKWHKKKNVAFLKFFHTFHVHFCLDDRVQTKNLFLSLLFTSQSYAVCISVLLFFLVFFFTCVYELLQAT